MLKIITDFEKFDPGTISIINWKSEIPDADGQPWKIYSGSLVTVGLGDSGNVQTPEIVFPYPENLQGDSKLLWDVLLTFPDGTVKKASGTAPVTTAAIPLLRALI